MQPSNAKPPVSRESTALRLTFLGALVVSIFVLLVEFGNRRHVSFPDTAAGCAPGTVVGVSCFPGDGSAATYEGPERNKIPAPDRSVAVRGAAYGWWRWVPSSRPRPSSPRA